MINNNKRIEYEEYEMLVKGNKNASERQQERYRRLLLVDWNFDVSRLSRLKTNNEFYYQSVQDILLTCSLVPFQFLSAPPPPQSTPQTWS